METLFGWLLSGGCGSGSLRQIGMSPEEKLGRGEAKVKDQECKQWTCVDQHLTGLRSQTSVAPRKAENRVGDELAMPQQQAPDTTRFGQVSITKAIQPAVVCLFELIVLRSN
jgi:hypothetical protein